ncbi:hypothetical protein BJ508DRAFT_417017, partial [Ascobolus immersus RN42]
MPPRLPPSILSTPVRASTKTPLITITSSHAFSTSPPRPDSTIQTSLQHCRTLLAQNNTSAHTLLPLFPPGSRASYLALHAFNLETANIPSHAPTLEIALMRVQFWRDIVNSIFSTKPGSGKLQLPERSHPVATALDFCVNVNPDARYTKSWFLSILKAREERIKSGLGAFATLEELDSYAEKTYGSLFYLLFEACLSNPKFVASFPGGESWSIAKRQEFEHILSHLGRATGMVNVLRGLPSSVVPPPQGVQGLGTRSTRGKVTLPVSLMVQHGVSEESILRYGPDAEGVRDVVFDVAAGAEGHVKTARRHLRESKVFSEKAERQRVWGLLAQGLPAVLWLERLEKCNFDV